MPGAPDWFSNGITIAVSPGLIVVCASAPKEPATDNTSTKRMSLGVRKVLTLYRLEFRAYERTDVGSSCSGSTWGAVGCIPVHPGSTVEPVIRRAPRSYVRYDQAH